MAGNTPFIPPDLASVLATLSQYAPPVQFHHPAPEIPGQQKPGVESHYEPEHPVLLDSTRQRPASQTPQPQQPLIDPATITEWSAGLRCVSKIAAQNRQFGEAIKEVVMLHVSCEDVQLMVADDSQSAET